MAKVRTSNRRRLEYLRRLSVVFAVEVRLKIVTELYLREMSPKQFHEEFGGGTLSRVDKNFKKLTEHGWLRYIRSETGGGRRGGRENFYRAKEVAIFENETWELVPYSMRVAISWRTFRQLAERVREALCAGTLDARADSHLSWVTVALDEQGWQRILGEVDMLFESIFEEHDDAKLRALHTEEAPMVATVALAVFESPSRGGAASVKPEMRELVRVERESPVPFSSRVSKAFADELCLTIVREANLREISAPLFHAEVGGDSIDGIRRRFKKMEAAGWLRQVNEKTGGRRRSAVELFYKATGPVIFDRDGWAEPPPSAKPGAEDSWTSFMEFAEAGRQALASGTLENRLDNHLSWSLLRLDETGWARVASAVDEVSKLIGKERAAAAARLARSGEEPVVTTVGLAAFESPKGADREP